MDSVLASEWLWVCLSCPICTLGIITAPGLPASLDSYKGQEHRWKCRENQNVPTLGRSEYRALWFTKYTLWKAHPSVTSGQPMSPLPQLINPLMHMGKLKQRNPTPRLRSGKVVGNRPGQEPGAPPTTSARRRHGPTASPGRRDSQTAIAVRDLHTGSQLPGFAERRAPEVPGGPGAPGSGGGECTETELEIRSPENQLPLPAV